MSDLTPRSGPRIETKEIGGETMLVSGDDIHVLNETAAFIWGLCDGAHTPAEMEAALREEYAIPADRDVAADIAQTLAHFRAKGLLDAG